MARPRTIEAIERATVEGVAPRQVQEIEGWLVAMDEGVIGRARSAPTRPGATSLQATIRKAAQAASPL